MPSDTAYDIFTPERIEVLFKTISPPDRVATDMFGNPRVMGRHEFSMASVDDPFSMLPPVGTVEDAKEMLSYHGIENYELQPYRGYVDIPDRLIQQWQGAGMQLQMLEDVRERYIMPIREAVDNTIEYVCFNAMDTKDAVLATSHDWTAGATTADNIIEDITLAAKAYKDATRKIPTVAVHNTTSTAQIMLRKDLANQLYFPGNQQLITGSLGKYQGLDNVEQIGGYKDFEGESLAMFQPTTPAKNLTMILNPKVFGYPVAFGSPKFTTEYIPGKEVTRVYATFHAAFVYLKDTVSSITV